MTGHVINAMLDMLGHALGFIVSMLIHFTNYLAITTTNM